MSKTKIICTLGPASNTEGVIKQMIASNMNCARINLSHGSCEENQPLVTLVKKIRQKLNKPIAIMFDTKGPEIRIGKFKNGSVLLKKGCIFNITTKEVLGDETVVSCSYKSLCSDVKVGAKILINDGLVVLKVLNVFENIIETRVVVGGKISNKKSMFLPETKLNLPFLSEQDKKDLKFAVENDADYIAASFVSCKQDVEDIKNYLKRINGKDIKIIAKIESMRGVKNIDEILEVSDGIMVARGDLGVEISIEKLPQIQKDLIQRANEKGKIAITATEMLESMIEKTRPTRAEVCDVANAVFDGSSAIMLSGETAVGKNPALVVKTMEKIASSAEKTMKNSSNIVVKKALDITDSISHSTTIISNEIDAKAIVVFTVGGHTAIKVARFRPKKKIVAFTISDKVFNQLALCYNVYPQKCKTFLDIDEMFILATKIVKKLHFAKNGDNIVISAGLPLGGASATNMIKIEKIK